MLSFSALSRSLYIFISVESVVTSFQCLHYFLTKQKNRLFMLRWNERCHSNKQKENETFLPLISSISYNKNIVVFKRKPHTCTIVKIEYNFIFIFLCKSLSFFLLSFETEHDKCAWLLSLASLVICEMSIFCLCWTSKPYENIVVGKFCMRRVFQVEDISNWLKWKINFMWSIKLNSLWEHNVCLWKVYIFEIYMNLFSKQILKFLDFSWAYSLVIFKY